MTTKLSERGWQLLQLISRRTRFDGRGNLECYWIPSDRIEFISWNGDSCFPINVSGSDALTLKSLERKGLIARPEGCSDLIVYAYFLTDEGKHKLGEMFNA